MSTEASWVSGGLASPPHLCEGTPFLPSPCSLGEQTGVTLGVPSSQASDPALPLSVTHRVGSSLPSTAPMFFFFSTDFTL